MTADRQGLISAEPPPSLPPFERVPRGQRKTREYSPQWHPAGESLCLNGNNWWLCQVPGGPHDGCWPPDLERLAELARNLPSGGDGSGTPWLACTVPGSVQSAIIENGLLAEPWYAGTNARVLEKATVGKESWFFKRFTVPKTWSGKRVRLYLGAVDYRANYYLNGVWVGTSEGHFAPVVLDVEAALQPGGENLLAVQIDAFPYDSPVNPARGRDQSAQCPRSQVLANYRGYDFVPCACPLGITDDVYLLAADGAFIEDVWVRSTLTDDFTRADLALEVTVNAREAMTGVLRVTIRAEDDAHGGGLSQRIPVKLDRGQNLLRADMTLDHPRLWWPNGAGPQALYQAEINLVDQTGQVVHQYRQLFGIRKLEMAFNEGHDLSLFPLTVVINGRKIYLKGAGWTPPDLFHCQEGWRYAWLLRQAQTAHLNLLRWWGGGVPERRAFYDWCDRLGILIWHDLFLANNDHDQPRFLRLLPEQVSGFVKQRRNHPCLIEWNGGNELFVMAPPANAQVYETLWKLVPELDPMRPFHPSSPTIGIKHAITDYSYDPEHDYARANAFGPDPELGLKIREGEYPAWVLSGFPRPNAIYQDWIARLQKHAFDPHDPAQRANALDIQLTLEGGASSVANYATLLKIIPPDERDGYRRDPLPPSAAWLYHNAQPGYYDWLQHQRTVQMFGPIADLETYVLASQFARAQIIAYGVEEMRRRKFEMSGTSVWQYNEPWPNAAGNCLVDYFGDARLPYSFLQRAFEAVHVSLRFSQVQWKGGDRFYAEWWVSNDRFTDLPEVEASWRIVDAEGREVARQQITTQIPANASRRLGEVIWDIPETYDTFFIVYCCLREGSGAEPLSQNEYLYTAHTSTPNAFSPLLLADPTRLDWEVTEVDGHRMTVRVRNAGTRNALLCHLASPIAEGSLVLWSADAFCLAPSEHRVVHLEYYRKEGEPGDAQNLNVQYSALNGRASMGS